MSRKLYCDEHGHVMDGGLTFVPPGIEATMTLFCPLCGREVFPDDPLTGIERQGKTAPTFEEWKRGQSGPVLDLGRIRLEDDPA